MKRLEEWLASSSSSSDDDSNNAPAVSVHSPRVPRAGELTHSSDVRLRQEEMRERMRNLLGDGAVRAVVAESSTIAKAPTTSPLPQATSTSEKSPSQQKGKGGGVRTDRVGSGSRRNTGSSRNSRDGGSGSSRGGNRHQRGATSPPAELRRVEVMVVDRGTQTTSTVGCQTDPVENYAPCVGYPLPRCCACSYGRLGGPSARVLLEKEGTEETPLRFREQLDVIRHSIDMMIARYNLPPPPSFSNVQ